jgi:uncharacterized protein
MNLRRKSLILLVLMLCSVAVSACGPGATPEPVTVVATSSAKEEPSPTAAPTQPPAATAVPEPIETPPPEAEADSVTVYALSVSRLPDGSSTGKAKPATITVRQKDKPGLRVGFFDSEVEGTGPQKRAAGWSAVTLSSLLLGLNPEQFEFSFDSGGGWADVPSAGGLTTVAVLAALLGDPVREDAAMTGTINPDGTIGPVGGIPHKIEGAADAGKTLVLVPAVQRRDWNSNLGEYVDLVDWGEKLGVEVRLVANVFDASEIYTGRSILRPQSSERAEFPPLAYDRLQAATKAWLSRYAEAVNRFNSLSDDARRDREPNYGYEQMQLADRALAEGLVALAHQRAWEAAMDAETSLQAATLDEVYYQQGVDALLDQLDAAAISDYRLDAVFEQLAAKQPGTTTEVIALADGWSNLAQAWTLVIQANEVWHRIDKNRDEADEDQFRNWIYEAASSTHRLMSI